MAGGGAGITEATEPKPVAREDRPPKKGIVLDSLEKVAAEIGKIVLRTARFERIAKKAGCAYFEQTRVGIIIGPAHINLVALLKKVNNLGPLCHVQRIAPAGSSSELRSESVA